MRHLKRLASALALGAVPALVGACGGGPAPGCYYSLSRSGQGLQAAGGDIQIQVTAPAGCTWTFRGNDPWVMVHDAPPAPSGNGNGTVVATLAANAGVRRVGTATIAYQTFTIDQAGTDGAGACSFAIYPTEATVSSAGGPGAFAIVPSAPDCSWWVEARSPDDDFVDGDYHVGIGTGVSTYQFLPSTTLPSIPPPRTARIGVHNSTGAIVLEHRVTQTP